MPIHQYKCLECENNYEILHKSKELVENIKCPKCNSISYKKLISNFTASVSYSPSAPCATSYCGKTYDGCSSGKCNLN